MKDFNIQVILDREIIGKRDISRTAYEIVNSGSAILQLRDKVSTDKIFLQEAKILRDLTGKFGWKLIINDRPDVAVACGADGIHLGQDDMPYIEARRIMGRKKLLGISTHNIEQARAAEAAGADYIGVGPIFTTPAKPLLEPLGTDIVRRVIETIKIPAFFIGGIGLENIGRIIERGGRNIAVASAILKSGDIAAATKAFITAIMGKALETEA